MNYDDIRRKYYSGMATGLANNLIFHPIDIIRIRLFFKKSDMGSTRSLFNGLTFNLGSGCIKSMAIFPTQDLARAWLIKRGVESQQAEMYSGFAVGCLLGAISNPINAIKTPIQATRSRLTTFGVCQNIYNTYGIYGFYRGGFAIFARDVTWSGIYFPLYRYVYERWWDNKFGSSLVASVASMVASYPLDGIRLYRQHHKNDYNFWHGFWESFKLNRSNLKSFAVGVVRVPLSTTFCHMFYLWFNKLW